MRDRKGEEHRECVAKWHPNVFTFKHLDMLLPQEPDFLNNDEKRVANDDNDVIIRDDNEKVAPARRSKREARGVPPPRVGALGCMHDQHASMLDVSHAQLHDAVEMSVDDMENIPSSHTHAIAGSEKEKWMPSMQSEINSPRKRGTFIIQQHPKNAKPVGAKWVFKKKTNGDGSVRCESRLVAKGFTQQKDIDHFRACSPTLSLASLRVSLAYATTMGLKSCNLDVETAFLCGDVDVASCMKTPEGCTPVNNDEASMMSSPRSACSLKKCAHGLKQASRQFHMKLKSVLVGAGFSPLHADPCVFHKKSQRNNGPTVTGAHVDDCACSCKDNTDYEWFKDIINDDFRCEDLGPLRCCLGSQTSQSAEGEHTLSQERHISLMAEKFAILPSKRAQNAMQKSLEHEVATPVDATKHRRLLGAMLHLAVASRPDISCAVSRLAQFSTDPRDDHHMAAMRLVRCSLNTKGCVISCSNDGEGLKCSCENKKKVPHPVSAAADSSFLSCSLTGRSQAGCILHCGGAPVIWKSFLQRVVAGSTGEAECVAMGEATRELICARQFSCELGVCCENPSTSLEDDAPSMRVAENPGFTQRSKSMRVKHHIVRDALSEGIVQMTKVPGADDVADVMTKPMTVAKTKQCNRHLFKNAKLSQWNTHTLLIAN